MMLWRGGFQFAKLSIFGKCFQGVKFNDGTRSSLITKRCKRKEVREKTREKTRKREKNKEDYSL